MDIEAFKITKDALIGLGFKVKRVAPSIEVFTGHECQIVCEESNFIFVEGSKQTLLHTMTDVMLNVCARRQQMGWDNHKKHTTHAMKFLMGEESYTPSN
jgi:hypothetical protein